MPESAGPQSGTSLAPGLKHPWRFAGNLRGLYVRPAASDYPSPLDCVQADAGCGLKGDRHADPMSPRQILIASVGAYRDLHLPALALRENLLIDFPSDQLCSGTLMRIGCEVLLWVTFQCEPCKLLEQRNPGVIKSLKGRRGVLARVLQGGTVRGGDPICLADSDIPPMSDDWKDRVLAVLQQVPCSKIVNYRQLARLAGVATSYCRAFPRFLSVSYPELAQRAQAGTVIASEKRWDGADLFDVQRHVKELLSDTSHS